MRIPQKLGAEGAPRSALLLYLAAVAVTPRAQIYQNITETIGSTPIIKINRLAPEGVEIYAKAEFFNPCSSVKDR